MPTNYVHGLEVIDPISITVVDIDHPQIKEEEVKMTEVNTTPVVGPVIYNQAFWDNIEATRAQGFTVVPKRTMVEKAIRKLPSMPKFKMPAIFKKKDKEAEAS